VPPALAVSPPRLCVCCTLLTAGVAGVRGGATRGDGPRMRIHGAARVRGGVATLKPVTALAHKLKAIVAFSRCCVARQAARRGTAVAGRSVASISLRKCCSTYQTAA